MVREVIQPINNTYTLNLPDEMIGKTVEVIAFEIDMNKNESGVKPLKSIKNIKERYSRYPIISHDSYRFDRDEANDYE